ncbi:hypothetical protein V8C40DRAFT_240637 [Trichoderma camerunense]
MPDRTRISTRTWAGILVTHGVYYENSWYPVVLGLEGSVKTWPRKWVTPVSLEIETKKSTAPLPFPPSLALISPALNMARLSSLAHTKHMDTNTHIHYPRVVRPCVTGGARQLSDDIRSSTPIGAHYSFFNLSSSASRTPHALLSS